MAVDRSPMCVRWWTVGPPLPREWAFVTVVTMARYMRFEGRYVALYGPSPRRRARATEVAEVGELPSRRGRACGELVGDILRIEHRGQEFLVDVGDRSADLRLAPRW